MNQENRILIIDDTPTHIDYLIRYLNQAGFQMLVAKDGKTGLELARHSQPDIILLDVLMPDVDGFETCRRLKNDAITCDIPVIFMTALSSVGNKVAGFEVGAVDYVTKPIDQQEVMARITTHLTIRNLQQDLQVEVVERRKTEEMLRQYTEMLRTQNEELDAFAHTVAHNLKNPLGLLTSLAEFLHTEHHRMKGEELSECLRLMSQDGYKAITIIEDLLLFASVRKDEVEAEPLDMIEIVTLSNHRLTSMIECNKAEIIFPDSWPTALGYAPWIEEVWVNYVSNAIKYGGRPPQIKLGATMQNNSMIRFWVKDNGLGLSTSEQRQLFTPFTRLSSLKVEGHGLGLSIVRRIVEKLGGQVHIESDGIPGQGSVFSFTLPAAPLKTTVLSCQTNHVLTAV